jgi:hypothetical protein
VWKLNFAEAIRWVQVVFAGLIDDPQHT